MLNPEIYNTKVLTLEDTGCVINLFLLLLLIILQAVCCVYFEIIAFLHLADFQVLICRISKIFKQSKLSYIF